MTVGERIKESRLKRGMSQVDLASEAGISKQTLYKYETGVVTNIPSDKIEAIADLLSVTPSYLMGWSDPQQSQLKCTLTEAEVLRKYRTLDELDKAKIEERIDILLEQDKYQDTGVKKIS